MCALDAGSTMPVKIVSGYELKSWLYAEIYPGEGVRGLPDDWVLQRKSQPLPGEVLVLSDHLMVRALLLSFSLQFREIRSLVVAPFCDQLDFYFSSCGSFFSHSFSFI